MERYRLKFSDSRSFNIVWAGIPRHRQRDCYVLAMPAEAQGYDFSSFGEPLTLTEARAYVEANKAKLGTLVNDCLGLQIADPIDHRQHVLFVPPVPVRS
jgi:hypothetical protein